MTVKLIDSMGDDLTVVNAARVSFGRRSDRLSRADKGLIAYLMRERHASPFEHVALSFYVETSIAVAREWFRHRTQSFNERSGRYTEYEEAFLTPEPRRQEGKPGDYQFDPLPPDQDEAARTVIESAYDCAYASYRVLLESGVAREVARSVLPLGTQTQFYATANLRNWFNFLSLRTAPNALREFREEAAQVEYYIAQIVPYTHGAWHEQGRGAL